jgi:hypothetical protein
MADDPTLKLDLDEFTLGELDALYEISGVEVGALRAGGGRIEMTPKVLIALVYILRRRKEPAYTVEDARNEKAGVLPELLASGLGPTSPTSRSGRAPRSASSTRATRSR